MPAGKPKEIAQEGEHHHLRPKQTWERRDRSTKRLPIRQSRHADVNIEPAITNQITSQLQLKRIAPPTSPCEKRTTARVAPQAGQGTPVACNIGQPPPPLAIEVLKQSSAVSSGATRTASAPPPK